MEQMNQKCAKHYCEQLVMSNEEGQICDDCSQFWPSLMDPNTVEPANKMPGLPASSSSGKPAK